MKKLLIILLVLVLSFSVVFLGGCSSNSSSDDSKSESTGDEAAKFSFDDYELKFSKETMIEKVILDDEHLTIGLYAVGITETWGAPAYFFRIVNKADHAIGLMITDGVLNVNGTPETWSFSSQESSGYRFISADKTEDIYMDWDVVDFDERNEAFENMNNIEGIIQLLDCSSLPDRPVIKEYTFTDVTGQDPTME